MGMYEVTERLYQTADGRVVPEGHPEMRLLFASKGRKIPEALARKHGLLDDDAPGAEEDEAVEGRVVEPEQPAAGEVDEPDAMVCADCGFGAKTAAGLVTHQRSHQTEDGEET